MSKMENERIIKLYGKYRTEEFYNIIMEYCNGGDLRNFLLTHTLGQNRALGAVTCQMRESMAQ